MLKTFVQDSCTMLQAWHSVESIKASMADRRVDPRNLEGIAHARLRLTRKAAGFVLFLPADPFLSEPRQTSLA